MKSLFLHLLFIYACFLFAGCNTTKSLPAPTTENKNRQQITTVNSTVVWTQHSNGDRQTLIQIDSLGNIKVLGAQASEQDFLKNIMPDSTVKIKGNIDVAQLLKLQTQLAKIRQQSSGILLTNEALYRLSEAYFNGLIDSSKYEQLYNKVLSQSMELIEAEIELEEAKAETIQAETEKAKVELQKKQLEFEMLKLEKGIIEEKKIPTDTVKQED